MEQENQQLQAEVKQLRSQEDTSGAARDRKRGRKQSKASRVGPSAPRRKKQKGVGPATGRTPRKAPEVRKTVTQDVRKVRNAQKKQKAAAKKAAAKAIVPIGPVWPWPSGELGGIAQYDEVNSTVWNVDKEALESNPEAFTSSIPSVFNGMLDSNVTLT